MTFLVISFLAGMLTVLAPCILPLLPVVVGAGAAGRNKSTPLVVVSSLGVSIIVFTFLLKASTTFITVPQAFWAGLSGSILILFGLTLVFPKLWNVMPGVSRVSTASNKLLGSGALKKSVWGDIMVGAALGPVFSTCSPTYFVILATVLPASFLLGTTYLFAYVFGLSSILLLISILGQRFANTLAAASVAHGTLKRVLGVLFIILGLTITLGFEKKIELAILNGGYFDVTKIEQLLLQKNAEKTRIDEPTKDMGASSLKGATTSEESLSPIRQETPLAGALIPTVPHKTIVEPAPVVVPPKKSTPSAATLIMPTSEADSYKEIVSPAGYVNTDGNAFTIGEYVGKKVILVNFLTYNCINCQRTLPYINTWYKKYKDEGFVVIGIHTPEFAFEREMDNVKKALAGLGVEFPVVLDNSYSTWNAYGNQFWPHEYLIDLTGKIVYDHAGEGAYDVTETKIKELLRK